MNTSLTWKHFPADEPGFFRAPVLISGDNEAVLIDGGFTYTDGYSMVEAVRKNGKRLTSIYISQSDPDYYFSLKPIKDAFSSAAVIAASETIRAIENSVDKKLSVWSPQLKEDGPQSVADIVMPEPYDSTTLTIEGESIEIVDAKGLTNRRYLWVPSLQAIFGGILLFGGVHVWTADTPTVEDREAWVRCLDEMETRHPATVVPGHMTPETRLDASSIAYTKSYLLAFEEELAKAPDSAALVMAMTSRYPSAGMSVALQIGAKVAKGEMKWG